MKTILKLTPDHETGCKAQIQEDPVVKEEGKLADGKQGRSTHNGLYGHGRIGFFGEPHLHT